MGHEVFKLCVQANYMPKCQMSSGPYGPIFGQIHGRIWYILNTMSIWTILYQKCGAIPS